MTRKVLIVDDDKNVLDSFRRGLRKLIDLTTAEGAKAGLEAIKNNGPFDVIVSDQQMPGIDGITFLKEAKALSPLSVRIMLTGHADQETAMRAVNQGEIFRFLSKPCAIEDFADALKAAWHQYDLVHAERELLEKTLAGSVKVLVDVLSSVDPDAFSKINRVRDWGRMVAARLPEVNAWELDMAIMLSRLGRVLLPAEIAAKIKAGSELTPSEAAIVRRTPETARDLIMNIPRLGKVASAIYYHQKAYDGSGFPDDEVKGKDLPLLSRLIKILLDLSELTTQRLPHASALAQLKTHAHFYDPLLLTQVIAILPTYDERLDQDSDVKDVTVMGLKSGDELVKNLLLKNGQLALASGFQITEATLKKVRHLHSLYGIAEPIAVRRDL